ncbi:MAG: hypothetical protein ACI8QZ_001538 [Chlamydiales bacterium]|jgi:hypothetical protein
MRTSIVAPWRTALAFVLLLAPLGAGLPATQGGEYTGNRPDRVEEVARGLRRTVLSLTSEQRAGRRAGTKGELDTALWLVSQLRNYNLTPAGEDEYLQPFEVPLPVRDGGDSWIQARSRFEGAQQVVPLPSSAPGGCKGPVEYHGLGLESEAEGWHDYPSDVAPGTVVLIVDGLGVDKDLIELMRITTNGMIPTVAQSELMQATTYGKIETAAQRGAGALLLAQHPDDESDVLAGFQPQLVASIPALRISRDVAEALYPGYAAAARASLSADLAHAQLERPATAEAVEVFVNIEGGHATAYNVLARIEGSGGPTVILSAHLDHLGRGGLGSLAPEREGEIHPGADDNASGVAVVWHLVDEILGGWVPDGDIVFAFWSGHALGSLGSRHWLEQPSFPLEELAAIVNLDGVGRAGSGRLEILGAGSSAAFADWWEPIGQRAGLELVPELSSAGVGGSDLQPFLKRRIPGLHLTTGMHDDRHRPGDDVAGFESEAAASVASVAVHLIGLLQAADELPFSEPGAPQAESAAAISLGVDVVDESGAHGLAIASTQAGGSAERAGLLPGDVLLQVGDVNIDGESSIMRLERFYAPGDVVSIRFLRSGIECSMPMTLQP